MSQAVFSLFTVPFFPTDFPFFLIFWQLAVLSMIFPLSERGRSFILPRYRVQVLRCGNSGLSSMSESFSPATKWWILPSKADSPFFKNFRASCVLPFSSFLLYTASLSAGIPPSSAKSCFRKKVPAIPFHVFSRHPGRLLPISFTSSFASPKRPASVGLTPIPINALPFAF